MASCKRSLRNTACSCLKDEATGGTIRPGFKNPDPLPQKTTRPHTLHRGRHKHFFTSGPVDEGKLMRRIGILNRPDSQNLRKVDVFPHHDWHQ